MRLDKVLVERKLVPTRAKAADLIKQGQVKVNQQIITKTSYIVKETDTLEIIQAGPLYVGRGALKLESALRSFPLILEGLIVADIGASTGGFTDYLLQKGIQKSYCIDVGTNQLDPKLKHDPRVIDMPGINIRNPLQLDEEVDLLVADLSFISLGLVIESMAQLVRKGGKLLLLFKPQFEVGKEYVGAKGVVKDESRALSQLNIFVSQCEALGLKDMGFAKCDIKGKEGNQEYFILLAKE